MSIGHKSKYFWTKLLWRLSAAAGHCLCILLAITTTPKQNRTPWTEQLIKIRKSRIGHGKNSVENMSSIPGLGHILRVFWEWEGRNEKKFVIWGHSWQLGVAPILAENYPAFDEFFSTSTLYPFSRALQAHPTWTSQTQLTAAQQEAALEASQEAPWNSWPSLYI